MNHTVKVNNPIMPKLPALPSAPNFRHSKAARPAELKQLEDRSDGNCYFDEEPVEGESPLNSCDENDYDDTENVRATTSALCDDSLHENHIKPQTTSTPSLSRHIRQGEDLESQDQMQKLLRQVQKLTDIDRENFRIIREAREEIRHLQEDVSKIKAALISHLPEEQGSEVFELEQHDTVDAFDAFAKRLEDKVFRTLVTKHFVAHYGQRDVGEVVLKVLKATMGDQLQQKYNRTGTRPKLQLPSLLEKCIHNTLRAFFKDEETITVRRGKEEVTTTVKQEMGKQVEVYISNAKTRLQRKK